MGNENQGNEPELKSVKRFLLSEIKGEGERMRRCMQFTVLIGLIAHAYAFSNLTINHDSLMEFYGLYQQKVSVGRFIVPIYRQMTGDVIVSLWLNGVLSLLYVGIAVHLISKMFSLNTVWENLVLAGVCVTNITVTCLAATYFHDLSGDMLALLLSVAAAYLWCKSEKVHLALRLIVGSVLLTASIGFYQAFIAVTATLVCIYAIQRLLNQESPQKVMLNVLAAAGGFVLAVILYFIAANIALRFYHTEFAEGGGTTIASIGENLKALLPQSVDAYRGVLEDLFSPTAHTVQAVFLWQARIVCILNGLLFAKMVWVLYVWSRKKRGVASVLLVIAALAVLPLCMCCVRIISTETHHLLRYAYCLYYLLILVVFDYARKEKIDRHPDYSNLLAACVIGVVVFCNIQVSNIGYVKKDLERQSALFNMTRVVTRLEEMEGYVPGETPVAIMGGYAPDKESVDVGLVAKGIGLGFDAQATYTGAIESYVQVVLQYDINFASWEEKVEIRAADAYKRMGCFPAKDSIAVIDGIVVVRMDTIK